MGPVHLSRCTFFALGPIRGCIFDAKNNTSGEEAKRRGIKGSGGEVPAVWGASGDKLDLADFCSEKRVPPLVKNRVKPNQVKEEIF